MSHLRDYYLFTVNQIIRQYTSKNNSFVISDETFSLLVSKTKAISEILKELGWYYDYGKHSSIFLQDKLNITSHVQINHFKNSNDLSNNFNYPLLSTKQFIDNLTIQQKQLKELVSKNQATPIGLISIGIKALAEVIINANKK